MKRLIQPEAIEGLTFRCADEFIAVHPHAQPDAALLLCNDPFSPHVLPTPPSSMTLAQAARLGLITDEERAAGMQSEPLRQAEARLQAALDAEAMASAACEAAFLEVEQLRG